MIPRREISIAFLDLHTAYTPKATIARKMQLPAIMSQVTREGTLSWPSPASLHKQLDGWNIEDGVGRGEWRSVEHGVGSLISPILRYIIDVLLHFVKFSYLVQCFRV